MTIVWCAAIECQHNKENQCTLPEINLTHGHVHTVHNGFMQHWQCRKFDESTQVAKLRKDFERLVAQRNQKEKPGGG